MKNVFKAALAAVFAVTLMLVTSCGGGGDSPSSVTKKFYTAVEKGDTKAMEQTATPETVGLMALFGEKAKEGIAANGKIKSTVEKIDGDKATVTVTFENGETTDVSLVKADGKWKVTADK